MTTQERMKILEMISEGKVSPEEGARLLDAANIGAAAEAAPAAPPAPAAPKAEPKPLTLVNTEGSTRRLRVKVIEDNGTRVNVNLPLSLMEIGLRIGGRFVDELNGLDSEMQLLMEAIQNDAVGKIVEVDDEDSHVEIYIE